MNKGTSLPGRIILSIAVALLVAGCGGGGGSGGGGNGEGNTGFTWLIPADEIVDGGPGKDGIPAIDQPDFDDASTIGSVQPDDLVIVLRDGFITKAYPHDVMDWHEVVNDSPSDDPFTMSYCPLTGSAVAWKGANTARSSFGVSGLLYNSNLILYDRDTDSSWAQMLQKSVWGPRAGQEPERIQVIEMSFRALLDMYPHAHVLTRNTGWERNYGIYPYGRYKTEAGLLFPVSNEDNRLHPKTRVIGIHSDTSSKVYQLDRFGATTQAVNDQFEDLSIVAVGNSALNFAAIFERELSDGTILTLSPVQDDLPNVMSDAEGNVWDIFGTAVSGPRVGTQLVMTRSFTAYWFAWVAFFEDAQIHFN